MQSASLFTLLLAATSPAVAEDVCTRDDPTSSPDSEMSLLQVGFTLQGNHAMNGYGPHDIGDKAPIESSGGAQQRRSQPHVCILARTCGPYSHCRPNPSQLKAFLFSIMAQTYTDWELHLLNAQGGGEVFEDDVANLHDKRVSNGPSNPEGFSINSFGYEATNFAMNKLLSGASKQKACSYFLFTNADNLYGHTFLETGLPGMQSGLDLLGFNFVTRYRQYHRYHYKKNRKEHVSFTESRKEHMPMQDAGFKEDHIDLGAALVSAEAIQEAKVQFQKKTARTEWNRADWDFFNDVSIRKGSKGSKVYDELLFFHQ